MISLVRLLSLCICLSVCLLAQKRDPGHSISAKYFQTMQNVVNLSCLCFVLLDTLYKCLKSCILSQHHGHAYCVNVLMNY